MEVLTQFSRWVIPLLFLGLPLYGWLKGVKVYEAFVAGAEQGFSTAIKIIPFLVGMLVAIGVFRASGAMDLLARFLDPLLGGLLPAEVLPLAIMRPLSGGGALGLTAELISTHGPDSYVGRLASIMQGSTDTTFYVLAIYFGSVGLSRYRYAVALGLIADFTGLLASAVIAGRFFGT